MNAVERATQIWSVLAWAARNQQVVTYGQLAALIGVPRPGLGQLLAPIQAYCRLQSLPPLTALVVSDTTGKPGSGFTAAEDVLAAQAQVFRFDWLQQGCPKPEDFEKALKDQG
ncbi:MAG: hypothetical protein Kow00123_03940 [Anaerolineales bacterium]